MSKSRVCIFKYGHQTAIVPFTEFETFESIQAYVENKWEELATGEYLITYSCGDQNNCFFNNQSDFVGLVLYLDLERLKRVSFLIEQHVFDKGSGNKSSVDKSSGGKDSGGKRKERSLVLVEPFFDQLVSGESSNGLVNSDQRKKQLATAGWADAITGVGQAFEEGAAGLRLSLCKFALEHGFSFKYLHNTTNKITAYCENKLTSGCKWRVYASIDSSTGLMTIKKYFPNHTCSPVFSQKHKHKRHRHLTSDLIAEEIQDSLRTCHSLTAKTIQSTVKQDYGLDISYRLSWNALEKARRGVFGDSSSSFSLLSEYFKRLKSRDITSDCQLELSAGNRFKRCFVAFGSSLSGFHSCRPMLFVDGTHLYGKYKGTLLTAVAKDGNNGLFPVAIAVVSIEDWDNWMWFLGCLKPHLLDRQITFISDRHSGIVNAVSVLYPNCYHAYCYYHLMQNLRAKLEHTNREYKKKMLSFFHRLAFAPSQELFKEILTGFLCEGGQRMSDFLANLPPEKYAQAYVKGKRYGSMASTAAESFNNQIKKYCGLPIVEFIDCIRVLLMTQVSRRYEEGLSWSTNLVPEYEKKLKQNVDMCRSWVVRKSSSAVFEVFSTPVAVVNLLDFKCSCGSWQQECFPCAHGLAALQYTDQDPLTVIEPFFTVKNYRESYSFSIPALTDFGEGSSANDPSFVEVLPPNVKRRSGRPKKKRIPSRGEISTKKLRCGRCLKSGHNRRTCDVPV